MLIINDHSATGALRAAKEIGHAAADMLVNLIRGKRPIQKHLVLPVELVVRKSTAPPP